MENVLTALIVIFLILFGALRLTDRAISSQEQLSDTWHEVQDGYVEAAGTRFNMSDVVVNADSVSLTLQNDGTTRLMDFDRWDLIASYYDTFGTYHVEYLPYSTISAPNSWHVTGIYLDAATGRNEAFDRGIWNPGEDLVVRIRQTASIGEGEAFQAVLASPVGVSLSAVASRNAPPQLVTNDPLTLSVGSGMTIDTALLQVTDIDHTTADLIYTITSVPVSGMLIPAMTFSQAQIDAGLVSYTHTGMNPGTDTFQFTVSDGEAVIGTFTFTITIGA